MKTLRVTVQFCFALCLLLLVASAASASTLTLTGDLYFPSLDGSSQDSDGLADGTFTVAEGLVLDGTIHCNDDLPLPANASACEIRIEVAGDLTLEPGSGIFAENRRGSGNGSHIRLEVGGALTLRGADGSLGGAIVSSSQMVNSGGVAGNLTVEVSGAVDLEAGSVLAASSPGTAGAITVTGDTVRVAGLVASGHSRNVLPSFLTGEVLAGGRSSQAGGPILLKALGSGEPALRIEPDAIVVSEGRWNGSRLVLLEGCGIEVFGLVASTSRNHGLTQVVLRSGKEILVDGRDLGNSNALERRFGRIRADGTQQGAAGYLVDLFAQSDIQVLGPDPEATGLFAVSSTPGDWPLRNAGGFINAISLAGTLTATGQAFETGRDIFGDKGGDVDLQAQGDVALDAATISSVGGFSSASYTAQGGRIDVRSFQGAVSWTFGKGDVRPTGSGILPPSRRGTIEITACTTVDTTGTEFPVNGSAVMPFPVENEGICSPTGPSLPDGEPPLPVCAPANHPPAPTGGPFSVPENSPNGTVVGAVSANDPDAGQTHTFSIADGNVSGAFAIDSTTGQITVANSSALNFEVISSFSLTIEVTDSGGLTGTATVIINLEDVADAPVAADEGTPANPFVEAVGNTLLEVRATSSPSTEAKVHFNGNILANDFHPGGTNDFVVTLEAVTSGAVVELHPENGTFTYLPPQGFVGVDSFTYRITDSDGQSDTATVYINVEHRVWYVRNNAEPDGLGRSTDPFDTLAEAETASSAGDTIYLFAGNDTTLGQSDGIELKSGQRLIGEGVPLAVPTAVNINGVDGLTLRSTTGNRPRIENDNEPDAPGEDNGVSVPAIAESATGVEIRGLEISGFDNAIDVTTTGANNASVTIRDNTITGANLEGIDVNAGSTGTVTLAIHGNTLETTGNGIDVQRTNGSAFITSFADNNVSGSSAGTGINISGVVFDLVPGGAFETVSGGATTIGAPGNGVGQSGLVLANVQGRLGFANLNVFAENGAGLRVSSPTAYTGSAGLQLEVGNPGMSILEATGGPVVDISQAAINLPLGAIKSTNSSTTGLALNSVTGSFSAEPASSISNITSPAGTAFQVGSSNVTITYPGTVSTAQGKGVELTGNTGSTISFSGTLTLTTGASPAFAATGGGTVASTITSSTLSTTTATALNVANTMIGSGGLKFRSISAGTVASGPTNGIVLNNTGSSGGLTVSGTGSAGSGGTIQKANGPGISLTSTTSVNLSWMSIQNGTDDGVNGSNVTGFSLANSTLSGNGDALGDNGIEFSGLFGSASLNNSIITGSHNNNAVIRNRNGILTMLSVSGSTFSSNVSTSDGDGLLFEASGTANMSINVSGSTFSAHHSDHFQAAALNGGVLNVVFSGNTLTGGHQAPLGQGVTINAATGAPGFSGSVTYDVAGNSISGAISNAIMANLGTSAAAASFKGQIRNNVIGSSGVALSCSTQANGINVEAHGNGTHTVAVTGNTIRRCFDRGINVLANDGSGVLNLTATNNLVTEMIDTNGVTGTPREAFILQAGSTSTNIFGTVDGHSVCLSLSGPSGNLIGGAFKNGDIRLRQRFRSSIRLPGYGGSPFDTTAVMDFLQGNNPGSTATVTSSDDAAVTTDGYFGEAACPLP